MDYRTEDRQTVTEGDRAFNYYDRKAGFVGPDAGDGWFDFLQDDGTTVLLNGGRVCSTDFAVLSGWIEQPTTTEPTTWTHRNSEATFPDSLMICPSRRKATPADDVATMPSYVKSWYVNHNRTIQDFVKHGVGAVNGLRTNEYGILSLARGIFVWATATGYADDGHLGEHAFRPMVEAFREALNGECGRLDCGTLDDWAVSFAALHGIEL